MTRNLILSGKVGKVIFFAFLIALARLNVFIYRSPSKFHYYEAENYS